jgi:hypothetical protein
MTASMSVSWHDAANQMAGDKHFEGLDLGSIFTGDQAQSSTCHACNKGYSTQRPHQLVVRCLHDCSVR